MFQSLNSEDMGIVIDAMQVVMVKKGDNVIT